MNRYQSKMNFAVKSKARGFATMGAGFMDQMETLKMEERLQLMKKTMEQEREERKNRGGQFWKSGQKGKLTTYANTILQSKLSSKKVGKVKMLMDEQLNLPVRNESSSLSKKLSDISKNPSGTYKPNTKNNMRLCGQCESNEAALCCIQCTEVYCTVCFSVYHKKGALRKHRSISLEVSSTPRSKPPNSEKRSPDLTLLSITTDTTSEQGDSQSPSAASGALKRNNEAAILSLMDGNYNEVESAASFQEALMAWRMNNQSSGAAGAAAAAAATVTSMGGAATSWANTMEVPSSEPKPKNNEGIYTNISTNTTERTASLASVMENTQTHTLSYAERLLLKKNRRTPISWKVCSLDATDHLENKDNSKQMKLSDTEETSNVLDAEKLPERHSIDEPVTFSSLYHLAAQDIKELDKSSIYGEELFPVTFENTQNELPDKVNISKSPSEDFPQHRINIAPLVQNFAEKRHPSSSASQSEEKSKTKSVSSPAASSFHQLGKKTPTSQVQSLKKQRPKSRTSFRDFQSTNLTTTPSKELLMVSQLAKSQYSHDDEQQSSLLMVGLSSNSRSNTGEVNSSEKHTLPKSNTGIRRPATTVKVSYNLYKMSPRSWHPNQSINQNLSDNEFHLSDPVSNKLRQEGNDRQSNLTSVEKQRKSPFDFPPNTIKPTSTTQAESAIMMAVGEQTRGNFTANSSHNKDQERSDTTLEVTSDSLQTMTEPTSDLTCLNNNAIISHDVETYNPVFPNSLAEEHLKKKSPALIHPIKKNKTVSPIMTDSTTPVHSVRSTYRSKTMPSIATIHLTNEDDLATRIYSARSIPRNNSVSPDITAEKTEDSFSTPVHSVKPSPRYKTISPVPLEMNSEDITHALSLKASTTFVDSVQNTQREESPIPTIIDVSDNFSDTPVLSVTNTPKSSTMFPIPTIIERKINHSISPCCSLEYTPRSKTLSTIQTPQDPQEEKCDTPSYSLKYTPRSKTMSTIQTHQDPQVKRCGTPVNSVKNTPRYKNMSPTSTILKMQLKSSDTPTSSFTKIDAEENLSHIVPRSKSISPISNMIEDLFETTTHSSSSSLSYKTPSSIATVIEIQDTSRNKTESPIPTIIDTQESVSDTHVPSVRSTSKSPIPTIIDKQLNSSVTPVLSPCDTPRTERSKVTTASSQLEDSPTSNYEEKDKSSHYNAMIYQMLVNKELNSYTPDPTDHIVPMLPTATNQENIINPEETGSPLCTPFTVSSTETDTSNSDCSTILSSNTTLLSTSAFPTCSSESVIPILSKETFPSHDKLASTFYMCNSEMFNADTSKQNLDSTPVPSGTTLKKGPISTKKYVIRRPPKYPDETNLQKFNASRDNNLQPKSPSPTLSVLEMKRINFKQFNQDQNVVSLEEKPSSEQKVPFLDMNRLSLSSQGEKLNSSTEDHESVFSSLTKMSVDSLEDKEEYEEETSESLFNKEEFLIGDHLQAEIDEIEDQIAEEIKVKALK